ncbi:SDR family NAD(P)-dependent oxidoreductase [Streptomyces lavendulae]|uniref:SDR family NAD(P)-dependent oxidoreductase n=1 Tax=Streptomyces lavendulae TaxID=1914 RepID=UPI0033DF6884
MAPSQYTQRAGPSARGDAGDHPGQAPLPPLRSALLSALRRSSTTAPAEPFLLDRRAAVRRATARRAGGRARAHPGQVERSPEPEQDPVMDAVDAALEGTVALVTGASSGIAAATADEWRRMVDINLTGLMNTTHAALPHPAAAAAEGSRRVADVVNVSSVAGRVALAGSSAYCATEYGVVAFSEALRQETAGRHVRVSVVEPGAVDTELREHNSPEVQEALTRRFGSIERLRARDVADTIGYVVTRPRQVAVAELLVRPTEQV